MRNVGRPLLLKGMATRSANIRGFDRSRKDMLFPKDNKKAPTHLVLCNRHGAVKLESLLLVQDIAVVHRMKCLIT